MPSIDERVVAMSFENAKFEAGVATTMATLAKLEVTLQKVGQTSGLSKIEAEASKITLTAPMTALDKLKQKLGMTNAGTTFSDMEKSAEKVSLTGPMTALDKLKQKLGMTNAGTTFSDMEKASAGVNFGSLTQAIDGIGVHFGALQTAVTVAFGTIVSKATLVGGQLAKSLSLGPITQGFDEYATNLQSIQTILANTQFSGATLQDVNAALQQLNTYSDQTIYNFSQMAKNIGTFTAAGVGLDQATASIKGIANLAALSGSSAEQASSAMYQLSQAIASGRVSLQDWNSVVNAGMGGATFQRALAQTAATMGTIADGALKIDKATGKATINGQSFRESITARPGEQSWLTSDVLTKTLEQFTGDLSAADLAAQGFNKSQIQAIMQTAKTAKNAATEVKTIKQVFDVAKESIGSGWAQTFQNIFGNFEEAKKTFTGMSNFLQDVISQNAAARNKVLAEWKKLGGREDLLAGLKAAFQDLGAILAPIHDAFRDIFPRQTGQQLAELTKNFREFAESLKVSPETADLLRRTFKGLFAVMDIGKTVVGEVLGVFADLFGVVGEGSGGFLSITASIGDFLVAVDQAVTKGNALAGIFKSIGAVLRVPLEIIKELAAALFAMFGGADPKKVQGVSDAMSELNQALLPLRGVLDDVHKGWEQFLNILSRVRDAVEPAFTNIVRFLAGFGNWVADAFENINWDRALAAIQTGLIGGIFLKIREALGGGLKIDLGGGVLKNLNETLSALTGNLKALQRGVQAATLLEIAAALAILAAGILVLSKIDSDKLSTSMSAIAVGLAQLVGAMVILSKTMSGGGLTAFAKMPLIAGSMILLATAVTILALAMKLMATMSWEELAKGLVGVGVALAAVGDATHFFNGPKTLVAAAALIPLAIGLNLLAVAVKMFGEMSWEEMTKGLVGAGVALAGIAMGLSLMPPSTLLIGPGLVGVAFAMTLLAGAVSAFGNMDLKSMIQGILGVAASIVAIGYSISLIPPTVALQAAGLILLAVALNGIAAAIAILGHMDIGTLVKGIVAMSVMLEALAFGLLAMSGTLPGSVALLAAAAAFAILGPALAFMGQLKWTTIIKGLVVMAAVLAVLAVAGALAAGPITALGLGLAVLGAGMLVISAALSLFVLALANLGSRGPKAIALMVAAFGAFLLVLPKMIIDFVKGLVVIVAEIAKLAPTIAKSLVSIASTLLDAIIKLSPKIAEAIGSLVGIIAKVLGDNVPVLIEAGFKLLIGLLSGIRDNISQVITLATDIIVKFITGLGENAPRIAEAGAETLVQFLSGITLHLDKVVASVAKMITTFLETVTAHIPAVIKSGALMILKFIAQIVAHIPQFIAAGARVVIAFLAGVGEAIPKLVVAGLRLAKRFLFGIADGLSGLADIGFRAIIRFLNGLEAAIRKNFDDLFQAGAGVADAIIDGLVAQFGKLGPVLRKALDEVFGLLPGWAKKILGISSPSKVFMEIGKLTMLGFIQGVENSSSGIKASMQSAAKNVVDTATSTLSAVPDLLEGIMDMDPVITPVLDLSGVKKDAKQLEDMTNVVPISAAASFNQASAISGEQQATAEAAQAAKTGDTFEFTQYNSSPESLTEIEIYRQTKNQLSQVKDVLNLAK